LNPLHETPDIIPIPLSNRAIFLQVGSIRWRATNVLGASKAEEQQCVKI
jgi:hypothetical protein